MERHKVIFDTDPGVDDAMALLFLQMSGRVDILGITTMFGNADTDATTRNALYLCERFGIDAPVARGADRPLTAPIIKPPHYVHGHNGLGDIPLPDSQAGTVDPRPAHSLIIDTVRAHPHEVTILAIGRMTNLALALREAPDIVPLVKQIVIMGGGFGYNGHVGTITPAAGANIFGDPHAADEILGAAWPITMVGLDVTKQTQMTTEFLESLTAGGGDVGRFIWDVTRHYEAFHKSNGGTSIYTHDPSAVAYLLDPSLFSTRSGSIRVVTEGIAMGMTIQKPDGHGFPPGPWDERPSHRICIDVDSPRLLELFRDSILRKTRT